MSETPKATNPAREKALDELIATGRYRECWIEGVRYALDIRNTAIAAGLSAGARRGLLMGL